MGNDHYDAVYIKDYIQTAGFCQSIAYSLLYEKVFDMKDVSEIVNTMLNSNTFIASNSNNSNNSLRDDHTRRKNSNRYYKSSKNKDVMIESEYKHMLETKITPFAFRVAKSLDPNIYRNIEYDTWIEMRKEMRLGSWYYGDGNLIRGTRCLLKSCEGTLQCYIQDLEKHNDQCVVYITSLAERRVVKYTDLNPEPDAKPWPLPYRFTTRSNTPTSLTNEVIPSNDLNNYSTNIMKDKKEIIKGQIAKGNKSNKKNQGKIGNRNVPALTLPIKTDLNDNNIKNFEGSPLHMQTPEQSFNESTILESQSSTSYQPQTFQQNQPSWIDQISDHQQLCSESTLYNISQDSLFPSPPEMPQWSIITENTPQETIPQPSPVVLLPHTAYSNYFDQQIHHSPLIPVTPLPSMPMYQPVYQNTPVTPLIYTTSQDGAAGGQEVLVMSPQTADSYSRMFPSGYNPPIDMSFLSPPYVFPPAGTPTGYYGAPIDAQGFVFPTPITPQK
nr:OTU domain-containing protein 4-like [Onthophagus taurus]